MRKLSRWLLVLLCAVIGLTVFCACGPTENTNDDETYKVTFYQNYDGAPVEQSVEVESGKPVAQPTDPTREGYRFSGWYLNKRGTGDTYDFSSAITEDIDLYAKWNQSQAELTLHYGYKVNNVEVTEVKYVEMGKALDIETLETPTRTGDEAEKFEFAGWYTSDKYTAQYDFNTEVIGNFALYANWKQVKADITLNHKDLDVGATETIVKVPVGEDITSYLITPEREGYDFVAWCDKDGTVFDATAGVTEDITLYASWAVKTYNVTFDWNFDGAPAAKEVEVEHNATVTLPAENEIPANGNNIFVGWTTDAAGENDFDSQIRVTGAMTLYAKWTAASSDSIVINFYLNQNETEAYHTIDNATVGGKISAPADPELDGYLFAGWANGSVSGAKWDFGSGIVSGSMNLYAIWLKGHTFEAEYTYLIGKYAASYSGDGIVEDPSVVLAGSKNGYVNWDDMHVSGGYYVYSMLYNGASLEFYINAAEAVTNARIVLRLAPDGSTYELDDDEYSVFVNGTRLQYGHLCLPIGKYASEDMNEAVKPPFFNYLLDVEVSLQKGENKIVLQTTNENNHGGTYAAETPAVDCIYVYAATTLTWVEREITDALGTHSTFAGSNVGVKLANVNYAVTYHGNFRLTWAGAGAAHYDTEVFSARGVDLWLPGKKEEE